MEAIILDIIVFAVIIICVILNAKKGFAAALVSLVAGIAALLIAFFVSLPVGNFIGDKIIYPIFENSFFSEEQNAGEGEQADEGITGFFEAFGAGIADIKDIIYSIGFDENKEVSDMTEEEYEKTLQGSEEELNESLLLYGIEKSDLEGKYDDVNQNGLLKTIAITMAENISAGIGRVIAFIVLFIAAWIVLKLVARAFKFLNHVPILKHVNRLAGALLGAVIGLIICYVFAFAVKVTMPVLSDKSGEGFTETSIEQTYVFKHFYAIGK